MPLAGGETPVQFLHLFPLGDEGGEVTKDAALERAISAVTAYMRVLAEYHDHTSAQVAARCQRDLIRLRSDRQVGRMEHTQGLGKGCLRNS